MKFRSKPKIIDAEQFVDVNNTPCGVVRKMVGSFFVTTIQGQDVPVNLGEWIVREPDGIHFYPIADEVFRKNYEGIKCT